MNKNSIRENMILGEMNTFGSMPMNEEEEKEVLLEVIDENLDANDKMGIRLSLYFSYDKEERDSHIHIINDIRKDTSLELDELNLENLKFLEDTIKELGQIHSFKYFKPEKYEISKELLKELSDDLEEYTKYNEYDMEQYKHDRETIKYELKDIKSKYKEFEQEKNRGKDKKKEITKKLPKEQSMANMITEIDFGQ
jgi:hypothetical protein